MNTILASIAVIAICMILFAIPIFVFNRKELPAGKCSAIPGSDKLSCEIDEKPEKSAN